MSERLPELLDCKALRVELGVTRAAAEAIMRNLPVIQIDGLRKVYVRRSDVAGYLNTRTFAKHEVPSPAGRAPVGSPRQGSSTLVPLYPSRRLGD